MSQDKSKTSIKRSATEYRLSITSNPASRRSSLGGSNNEGLSTSINNRANGINSNADDDENFVKEYILPQIREFSDSMITLDANFTQLNFIHESLVDLNESLGALLYGLMCNSWCVDFPHVSHDIEDELTVAKRLEALSNEKELLLKQLHTLKEESHLRKKTGGTKFVSPSFTSTQLRVPSSKAPGRQIQQQYIHDEVYHNGDGLIPADEVEEVDNDDNNSEASFVSNPGMETPAKRHKTSNSTIKDGAKTASKKMRRKSILHTIRNSMTTSDPNAATTGVADLMGKSRISLAGGATRIVPNRPVTVRSTSTMLNGHPARVSAPASITNIHNMPVKHKSSGSRPPFR